MPTIAQLEKLIQIEPDDPFGHYGLGQEKAKAGDHTGAIECYDRVIELDESYCYAYYFKAQSLHAQGLGEEATNTIDIGIKAAQSASDGKALSELTTLKQTLS
jgi:tetratricopeptide (TPR) repeat protein